jgi:hypothetical protein
MKEPLAKKILLNLHETFPERRICCFTSDLGQSFRMQVFVMKDLLPDAIFINQFEKPFA